MLTTKKDILGLGIYEPVLFSLLIFLLQHSLSLFTLTKGAFPVIKKVTLCTFKAR